MYFERKLLICGVVFSALFVNGCSLKPPASLKDQPYHHTADGFRNPPNSPKRDGSLAVRLKFFASIVWQQIKGRNDALPEGHSLPAADVADQLEQAGPNSVTWIGHATFLVNLGGVKILTDPVFSRRASPVSFAGPKRLVPPAIPLEQMHGVDIIVISHSHYDHLDLETLRNIPDREAITVVVPLGLGKYAMGMGFKAIHEVDWNESVSIGDVEVTAYPAVHWSNRSPFDVNKTLWMSYALHGNGATVFHTGDTETHPTVFKEIGADLKARYNGCDVGLMSVGAYAPRPMMRGAHMDPEGGVQVGLDLGCRAMVPMHWGTFILSLEPLSEPLERFRRAAGNKARIMRVGETLTVVPDNKS